MRSRNAQFPLALLATTLALLTAGCSDGPAGGATSGRIERTAAALQTRGSGTTPRLAAEGASTTSPQKLSEPAAPAKRMGSVPVMAVADRGTPGETSDITFDTIKFTMDKKEPFKREMITPQIEALSGRMIRIRGYILPSFKQHGLTQFILVRDNLECCFGPSAALYDCIVVEMEPGKAAEFSVRPVAVEGVFSVQILPGPTAERPLAIYHLRGTSVK